VTDKQVRRRPTRGWWWALAGIAVAVVIAIVLAIMYFGGSGPPQGALGTAKVKIGVRYDQPGVSVRNQDGSMTGFDVDVARYVAEQLGYGSDAIDWVEAAPTQRESLIGAGNVDFVVASYSITPERKQQVAFAGPYFQTGQSLLVRADDNGIVGPESLSSNKSVCTVDGSTPARRIQERYPDVKLFQLQSYPACIDALRGGGVDAVTTDAVILAGYAAQYPGTMKVVGQPFSVEMYGIGLAKGNNELRQKINEALQKMVDSGAWQAAFDKNLGPSGYKPPAPPRIDYNG